MSLGNWNPVGGDAVRDARAVNKAIHYLIQTHGHHYRKHSVESVQSLMDPHTITPVTGQPSKTLPGVQVFQNTVQDMAAILFLRGTRARPAPNLPQAKRRFAHVLTFAPKPGAYAVADAQAMFNELLYLCNNVSTGGLPIEILVTEDAVVVINGVNYPTDDPVLQAVFNIGLAGNPAYIVDDNTVTPESPPWSGDPLHRWLLYPR